MFATSSGSTRVFKHCPAIISFSISGAYQSMQILCSSGVSLTYTPSYGNKLTVQIEQADVVNCRYDMNSSACQTLIY
jgi:hypothetical protein